MKHLNTRIQNAGARDNRVWSEFTSGAISVVIKDHSRKCDGNCDKMLNIGDVAMRVSTNGGISTKYLCSSCYGDFKRGMMPRGAHHAGGYDGERKRRVDYVERQTPKGKDKFDFEDTP
jgi:hypothetical protein